MPVDPSSIAGLALWLDARTSAVFADTAGTIPAVAPNGRIRRIDSPAALSGAQWLAASDAIRPFRELNGIGFQVGTSFLGLSAPAGVTLPVAGCTFAGAFVNMCKGQGTSAVSTLISGTNGSVFAFLLAGSTLAAYADGGWDSGIAIPLGAEVAWCINVTSAGLALKFIINGTTVTANLVRAISGSAISGLAAGFASGLGQGAHCITSHLLGYNVSLNNTDRDNLLAFLVTQFPALPLNTPIIACAGDSIGAGFISSSPLTSWSSIVLGGTWSNPTPARLFNGAISGDTILGQTTAYTTFTRPVVTQAGRARPVVVIVEAMTNAMTDAAGFTAAQLLTQLYALCDMIRADGAKVAVWTPAVRNDVNAGAGFPAKRATMLADILTNGRTHADAIIDTNTIWSSLSDASGPDFVDGLHPSDSGHAKIAALTIAQIASLIAEAPALPPTPVYNPPSRVTRRYMAGSLPVIIRSV